MLDRNTRTYTVYLVVHTKLRKWGYRRCVKCLYMYACELPVYLVRVLEVENSLRVCYNYGAINQCGSVYLFVI